MNWFHALITYVRKAMVIAYTKSERGVVLDCIGLSCMAAAAFCFAVWLGLLAVGLGFLVINWRVD